jgi:Fe-Mn family superoxide dismutase
MDSGAIGGIFRLLPGSPAGWGAGGATPTHVVQQQGEPPMQKLTRRELLRTAGAGAAALVLSPLLVRAEEKPGFTLPKLPYAFDALQPSIDAQTMEIHHDKHHAAYVTNLNKALEGHPDLLKMDVFELMRNIKDVPENIRQAVINNGGGHANHSMFWLMMAPTGKGGEPKGDLAKAIDSGFGGFEKFQAAFKDAAMKRFGSGWAWLLLDKGKPVIVSTANQDCPLMAGKDPLLGIDVWEHAYYLKYQNRRADYVDAWWKVVNWDDVAERFKKAMK